VPDDERSGSCICCARRDPAPEDDPVCMVCRSRVAGQLRDIPALVDELFKHPAIDEAAKEIGDLWHVLRRAAGLTMPRPEPCPGVPCKHCDLCLLVRVPGSEYVECGGCSALLTEDEYRDWCKLLAAAARRNR
jgi:hypothetical protein